VVRLRLADFVREAGAEQIAAWDASIPWLQRECRELVECDSAAKAYTAILEYELPRESRRPDVIVLENGVVVVLELKGKRTPSRADLDQVSAYARDLRDYHAECAGRPVHAVLVPAGAGPEPRVADDVTVVGPAGVHRVLLDRTRREGVPTPLAPEAFLRADAYAPLPTLVRAARDLFEGHPLPRIRRARAHTVPAIDRLTEITREAARTKTRRLVLLTGVPGAGKTLVGLSLVHAGFLDDLAVPRKGVRPTAPAVFLSGNAPLVRVLQDALREAGGGGKTFVRGVKDYVKEHARDSTVVPPEHLLVFDEAQRAWDADQVRRKHADGGAEGRSEPEHFVEFASRIPEWSVVLGLIGRGQEIHVGEEGGLAQWRRAVEALPERDAWTVHAPAELEAVFQGSPVATRWEPSLNLDTEVRYHAATRLHEFVDQVLQGENEGESRARADRLHASGHRLLVTRSLDAAKQYARERYAEAPEARFGLLASARDVLLRDHGFSGLPTWPRQLDVAAWFNRPADHRHSACRLEAVATEFDVQGLELDLAILGWGSDYARRDGSWRVERLRRPRRKPVDLVGLRRNVYRVLLTRGRDGTIVFVPRDPWLDETYAYLRERGLRDLESAPA
jgi:hypothetical protein